MFKHITLYVWLMVFVGAALAQDEPQILYKETFDAGLNPALWEAYAEGWTVTDEGTLQVGNDLLEFETAYEDVAVTFDMRYLGGSGRLLRTHLRAGGDYNGITLVLSTDHLSLLRTNLANTDLPPELVAVVPLATSLRDGEWHVFQYMTLGGRVTASIDETPLMDVTFEELNLNPSGTVFFDGDYNDKSVEIDNVIFSTPDPTSQEEASPEQQVFENGTLFADDFSTETLNVSLWEPYTEQTWQVTEAGTLQVGEDFLLLPDANWADYTVQFDLRVTEPSDVLLDVILREAGDSLNYTFTLSEEFVTFFRADFDTAREPAGSAALPVSLADGEWHTLAFTVQGKTVEVVVDGELTFQTATQDWNPRGGISFHGGYDDKDIEIDNLIVTAVDGE